MATWIELEKGDDFLTQIVASLGDGTSLSWPGTAKVSYAWLDFESGSWVAVFVATDMNEAFEDGGEVRTKAYLAPSAFLMSFERRFRARFEDKHAAWAMQGKTMDDALSAVAADIRQVFQIAPAPSQPSLPH